MKSRRLLFLVNLMFVAMLSQHFTLAQHAHRVEIFGGFSYLRTEADSGDRNPFGFEASVTLNAKPWLGFVSDFGWYFDDLRIPGLEDVHRDFQSYLFGPRFTLRNPRFQPFVHLLVGGLRVNVETPPFSASDTVFLTDVGGGVDYGTGRLGWRIIQADYLISNLGDGSENDLRLSTGILFRF